MVATFTALTLVAVAALVVAERVDSRVGKWLAKPIASAGFVCAAVAAGGWERPFGRAILAALSLSLLGDLCLLSRARPAFLAGLAAFLMGHLAFAVAFVLRGVDLTWTVAGLLPLIVIAILVGRWLLPHVEAGMRPPVLVYIAVITVMVALALGCFRRGAPTVMLVAAASFFVSDIAVARDRFVAPGFGNRLWGLPLYYGAQLLFAWSLRS